MKAKGQIMEQKIALEPTLKKTTSLFGAIVKWGILALLLFTCIMAAYRKFGG
jgi:hypothetical protein